MKVVTGFAIFKKKGFIFGKNFTRQRPNRHGPIVVNKFIKSLKKGISIFVAFVKTLPIVYKYVGIKTINGNIRLTSKIC